MANEMLDSADVMRQLFGEREGLTHQTRNTLPQSMVEALDVIGFACFLCNGFAQFIAVCRREKTGYIGENLLIRSEPIS